MCVCYIHIRESWIYEGDLYYFYLYAKGFLTNIQDFQC